MSVTESVRHRLRLSRELLTGAASCAPMSDHPQRVACDLIISHDAATLALAAICQQLGRTPNKTRDSLLDYLVWLRSSNHPDKTPPGMDYCVDLHQARIELQDRYLLPSPDRWTRVKAVTLEYIEDWSRRYLGMELDAGAERAAQPGPEAPTANENDSQRRRCPRYECAGEAEVRIPFVGPPERATIINLSLGGCYAEMDQPFDVGRRVEIVLCVNGLSLRATGKVVYSQWGRAGEGLPTRYENPGIGIQFTGMSSGGHSRLQELIAELQENSSQACPSASSNTPRRQM